MGTRNMIMSQSSMKYENKAPVELIPKKNIASFLKTMQLLEE